ncbi:hypothetical protein E3A20_16870 [Planctomyces bekefii]|jgi:hypothetical protein|uniref:Uncharacterized protein n=1 Tax=Planctomyces bekefii TaxID=1653850 RepID=A0A5C6M7V6_9PLAN|nr:hypothetical protein E3A20_16870 [Planctomyces bekefii]
MYKKPNINYLVAEKDLEDKIKRALKSLFYPKINSLSKISAMRFLAPYLKTDTELSEKFDFLYQKEKDIYVRSEMAKILGYNPDIEWL